MSKRRKRPKHVCFNLVVDGSTATVLGDPEMDQKTRDALAEVVRAAKKQFAHRFSNCSDRGK